MEEKEHQPPGGAMPDNPLEQKPQPIPLAEEKRADQTISPEEPKTINDKPETSDMETHAHHLHKAPGQGWKHYLFEFLMLFLAVTLGFFVENLRERMVENHRENE